MAICIDQIYKEKSCIALKNTHPGVSVSDAYPIRIQLPV
jgi:hypothetical protein